MSTGDPGPYLNPGDNPGLDREPGYFARIDLHFARLMEQLSQASDPGVSVAAALVSRYTRQGHICIDLASHAGRVFQDEATGRRVECPPLKEWRESLASSPVVGRPGEYRPLILDPASRLYLWRYWNHEKILADKLLELGRQSVPLDIEAIRSRLGLHFPGQASGHIDWQKVAVLMGLKGALCIITGGPGTGKTTVVSHILAMLVHLDPKIRVALTAPTGKAAQRLDESLGRTIRSLQGAGVALTMPGLRASTIHRLLGVIPGRARVRHSAENPLPHDAVVVDEASMTSLSLMARLVQALKPGARLILVGDRDQLSSVEPGHVLGDICDIGSGPCYSRETCGLIREATGYELANGSPEGVQDCLVELRHTHRFGSESGIRQISEAVRAGDPDVCVQRILKGGFSDVCMQEISSPHLLPGHLEQAALEGYGPCLRATGIEERFDLFAGFRVLCALREGPFGVEAINRLIEEILSRKGFIRAGSLHYHGRPVLVTSNDYTVRLFNGDIGFILRDDLDGELRAFFPGPDGTVRRISLVRLPEHETAFAMTVHKSQGSEFSRVVLVLPPRQSPVLTRELVYTGITRASRRLDIWAGPEIFAFAAHRRTERMSGLNDLLRQSGLTGDSDDPPLGRR